MYRFIIKRMLAVEKTSLREKTRLTSPEVWAAATSKVWRDSGQASFFPPRWRRQKEAQLVGLKRQWLHMPHVESEL